MTVPFEYQREDVKTIERFNGRTLLAGEPGTGKTFTTLLYASQNAISRIIVVCPASVKYHWETEARTHCNMRSQILHGKKVVNELLLIEDTPTITIVNYDILTAWLSYLQSIKPQLIVVDECHYVADRSTKRTKALQSLCLDVPHIIALSGTPLVNRPAELWPILNIIRPTLFPSFFSFFAMRTSPFNLYLLN